MKWKLRATSDTLDGLAEVIKEYSCMSVCTLQPDGTVANAKGVISGWRWREYRGRYRFEIQVSK